MDGISGLLWYTKSPEENGTDNMGMIRHAVELNEETNFTPQRTTTKRKENTVV
jgi:hypothetical protein